MCQLATFGRPNEASLYYIYNLFTVLEITHRNRSLLACIFNNTAKADNVWFKNVQKVKRFRKMIIVYIVYKMPDSCKILSILFN